VNPFDAFAVFCAQLAKVFEPYGAMTDVLILRDRATGHSQGCGFISFMHKDSADRAIAALNEKVSLDAVR